MKKFRKVFVLWGIAALLTACGQKAAPTGNLAKDIHIDADSLKNTEKDSGVETRETEISARETAKEEQGAFCFEYEGAALVPGEPADLSALPKYADVSEVPSCAFGGNDNVYHFELFELTTYYDGDEERIYSVYFTDPNLPTTEGLRLGDTVDDMKALYGEDYAAEENAYTYTRGETSLCVITQNDVVVSIEYRLDV